MSLFLSWIYKILVIYNIYNQVASLRVLCNLFESNCVMKNPTNQVIYILVVCLYSVLDITLTEIHNTEPN